MRTALSTTLIAALIMALAPASYGQSDAWERVKLIEPGRKISVSLNTGKSINGKMQAWSTEGVTVLQGRDKVVQVPRADVAKVAMTAGMSRKSRAGYAALIGGGVGAGLFTGLCAGDSDCDIAPASIGLVAGMFIGGIAAGIAALIPQHKEVIYRAEGTR